MLKRIQQIDKRRLVILVGGVLLLLVLLFPPWRGNSRNGQYAGHGFILAPSIVFAIKSDGVAVNTDAKRLTVDFPILLVECLAILLIGAIGFALTKGSTP